MTEKKGFVEKLQELLLPIAQKIQSTNWLSAIGEGLGSITTVITVGALALTFCNIPFEGFQNFIKSTGVYNAFYFVYLMTMNIMSLYACVGIAYRYAEKIDVNGLSAVLSSLMAYLCLLPISEDTSTIATQYLGAQGMFIAIIAALGATRLMKVFEDKGVTVKLPDGVPPFVVDSFRMMFSGLATGVIAACLNWICAKTSFGSLPGIVYTLLQRPIVNLGGSLPGWMFIDWLSQAFFFTGIHGNTIASFLMPVRIQGTVTNAALIAQGLKPTEIFSFASMNWCSIGGAGSTLGLALLLCFAAKSARYRALGRVAIVPQICNINEPVLYGVPIILNPIMFIPFTFTTCVNTLIYYAVCKLGIMPIPSGVMTGMGVPNVVAAIINGTGVMGVVVMFGLLALDIVIYYPFFKVMDNQAVAAEKE